MRKIGELSEREKVVFSMAREGMKLKDVARYLDITPERVRQILSKVNRIKKIQNGDFALLSVRTINCLQDVGVHDVSGIVSYLKNRILEIRNFGNESLKEVIALLKEKKIMDLE